MARTFTAAQRNAIADPHPTHWLKVLVANADGTLVDLSSYATYAQWGETIDTPISTATVKFTRNDVGQQSLSPLRGDSTLNEYSGGYAPLLEKGRLIIVSTAVMTGGAVPAAGDYVEQWRGRIDKVQWQADPIQVDCSDLGAWVMDDYIQATKDYSGTATPVETVMQEILNDGEVFGGAPQLYTPTSPGWDIGSFTQERKGRLEALRDLATQIGWDCRYRYDAAGVSRLTLFDPDRTKSVADWTLGPSEYSDVTQLDTEIADIRNAVSVIYTRGTDGQVLTIEVQDTGSQLKYGVRWMEIQEASTSNIDTEAEATALANAALHDLSESPANQEVQTLYFWIVQLGDLGTFLANGVHYDSDQTLAVVGYQHTFENGQAMTVLTLAGHVVGAYHDWLKKDSGITFTQSVIGPPFCDISFSASDDHSMTLVFSGDLGEGASGHLDWQYRQTDGLAGTWGAWTAYDTVDNLPVNLVITRAAKFAKQVQLQVKQPDGQTALSNIFSVDGAITAIDGPTGNPVRGHPYDDGGYPLSSSTSDGYSAHQRANDSRGSPLNNAFRSNVDTAALVVETAGQKFVNGTALNASRQVDFGASGVINRIMANVVRSAINATPLSTVAAQLADSGHLASTIHVDGGTAPLYQRLADNFVPNADFDIWQAGAPLGWSMDGAGAASWSQDTSAGNVYSGTSSVKYSNPDGPSNSGWHGMDSHLVTPLRPGKTYRILVASKVSDATTTAQKKYRVFIYFNAAHTLSANKEFLYAAANTWQVDEWIVQVPTTAEPLSQVIVQFQRNGDPANRDFWFDSLRCDEQVLSTANMDATTGKPTGSFATGAADSRGSALNGMFRTNTDTLDAVLDGGTFRRVKAASLDGSGNVATVTLQDTRTTNQLPSWYRSAYDAATVKEFKQRTVLGLPGSVTYVNLTTTIPWVDISGGVIVQEATSNDGVYVRKGVSDDSAWGPWFQSYDQQNETFDSGAKDSRGSALNNTMRANIDTVDSVLDGSTYVRTTPTQRDGGGRAATTIDTNGTIWVPETTVVNVGTNGTAGAVTKTIRIPYFEFRPQRSVDSGDFSTIGYMQGGAAADNRFLAALPLPYGVTITALRWRLYMQSGVAFTNTGAVKMVIFRVPDDGSAAPSVVTINITAVTTFGAGWATHAATVNEDTLDRTYVLFMELDSDANLGLQPSYLKHAWVEVDYQVSNYLAQ